MTAKTATTKLSPAQMAARKANAQMSTGPTSDDGKRRAAKNALLHGLCSLAPVLPGEDPAEFERVLALWLKEMEPGNADERRMVYDMVCASRAVDRVRNAEAAALGVRMREAGEAFDRERAKSLAELADYVSRGRHDLVTTLLGRADGVRWLIGRWEAIDERLERSKHLCPDWRQLMLTMLGCVYGDLADDRAREVHALGMALDIACKDHLDTHAKLTKAGIQPDDDRPMERLRAVITAELEALGSLLPDLEQVEAAERREAVDAAAIDTSDAGSRRHRYLMDHQRTLRQLSASLVASKTARLKLYGRILASSHGEPAWTPPEPTPTPAEPPIRNEPKNEPILDRETTYAAPARPLARPTAAEFVIGRPPLPSGGAATRS